MKMTKRSDQNLLKSHYIIFTNTLRKTKVIIALDMLETDTESLVMWIIVSVRMMRLF